ncbi:MAG: acetylornithine deacetylase [Rhodobacteraceae bacterium]|nr:acetylornithine deacetylase [Paracoccaceae bacterium]
MNTDMTPLEILEKLVAFPTFSQDSNLELVDFVETYLRACGAEPGQMLSDCGQKAAVFTSVGPDAAGGVVLSGHSDVVPVTGQSWDSDPLVVTRRGDRLYGRGTCDMKGFDALALWAIGQACKRGLKRPLQLALSFDEEIGCEGAPPLISAMQEAGLPKAQTVIVGEPSMMQVITGHKGGFGYKVHMRGFEVHSSLLNTGVNAIMYGAKLIDWANEMNAQNEAAVPGPLAADFVPPFTTLHIGMIEGGTAHNITAADCHFCFDFRIVPGEQASVWAARFEAERARIEAQMQAVQPSSKITATPFFNVPALTSEEDGAAQALAQRLTGANRTEVVSYGTEAGHFQNAGYSVVVCGPGNIAQAHQPNEFISVAQFEQGHRFMNNLLDWLET